MLILLRMIFQAGDKNSNSDVLKLGNWESFDCLKNFSKTSFQ